MDSVISVANLLKCVVTDDDGHVDFEREGERLEAMWKFHKGCCRIAANLVSAWDYGEELAVDIIQRAFEKSEREIRDILDDDFANAQYGNYTESQYLDMMDDRCFQLKNICVPVMPWEERMIECWNVGNDDGVSAVMEEMQYSMGQALSNERLWRRIAAW